MEYHAANLDSSVNHADSVEYWRERAECLEEWVCELLMKNQSLRMDLQRERSQHHQPEEMPLAFSLLGLYQSPFPSARPVIRAKATELVPDANLASCPRKECAEIRESIVQSSVLNHFVPGASN